MDNLHELQLHNPDFKVTKGMWVRYEDMLFVEFGRVLSVNKPGKGSTQELTISVVFSCGACRDDFDKYKGKICSPFSLYPLNFLDLDKKYGIPKLVAADVSTPKYHRPFTEERPPDKNERSLLVYLECREIDHYGRILDDNMNGDDWAILSTWSQLGFVDWGRIAADDLHMVRGCTHWVRLSDRAIAEAHKQRVERIGRMRLDRAYRTSAEANDDIPAPRDLKKKKETT